MPPPLDLGLQGHVALVTGATTESVQRLRWSSPFMGPPSSCRTCASQIRESQRERKRTVATAPWTLSTSWRRLPRRAVAPSRSLTRSVMDALASVTSSRKNSPPVFDA